MQTCSNCGHSQQQGKFCAKCGTPIIIDQQTEQAQIQTYAQPNETIEQLKQVSNGYISKFVDLLKNPTKSLHETNSVVNGLISLVLFVFIAAFTIYTMINKAYSSTVGTFAGIFDERYSGLPIAALVFIMFAIAVFTFVADIAVFVLGKIFVGHVSFKQLFTQITNFYPTIIALMAVAFILQLIGITGFAILAIIFALSIAILFIPLYVIVHLLQNENTKIDVFHIYLIMAFIIFFLIYLVSSSAISSMIDELRSDIFDFY